MHGTPGIGVLDAVESAERAVTPMSAVGVSAGAGVLGQDWAQATKTATTKWAMRSSRV